MSRRRDHVVEFEAPTETIYQIFTSPQYWEALMDSYRELIPQSEITRFRCDDTGTHIVFTQTLPRENLLPIARTVIPVDMVITRKQHFEPYDHSRNHAKGTYGASIPASPGRFGGKYFLTDTETGSQLRFASVCKIWIPFIGGKLEDLLLSSITQLFDGEAAFTGDWIAKHH